MHQIVVLCGSFCYLNSKRYQDNMLHYAWEDCMKDYNFNEAVDYGVKKNNQIQKRGKNKKQNSIVAIIVVILLVIAAIVTIIIGLLSTNSYYAKYKEVYLDMSQSERQCESVVSEVSSIWYDAIYVKGSSNPKADIEALYTPGGNVPSLKEADLNNFRKDVSDIRSMQIQITADMKKIANPPDKYKIAYNELASLLKIYQELCDQALNPDGTYKAYASDVNKKSDDFKAEYEKIQLMFPDIEK